MMTTSFAFQETSTPTSQLQQLNTNSMRKMTQTSHFNIPQQKYVPLQYSPNGILTDKENFNSLNEMISQRQNSNTSQFIELMNDNVKVDQSIVEEELSLQERFNHAKWQIRRKTYAELSEAFQDPQTQINIQEFPQGWLSNIVQDKNEIALQEGLRFMYNFVSSNQLQSNVVQYLIPDLIERAAFLKMQQMTTVQKIILQIIQQSSDFNFVVLECIRKIESKHPKVIAFSLGLMNVLLNDFEQWVTQDQLRQVFKSSTQVIKHTVKDVRNQATTLFGTAFSMVQDPFESLQQRFFSKKELRSVQLRDLEAVCEKVGKKQGIQLRKLENQIINSSRNLQKTQNQDKISDGQQLPIDMQQLLPDKFYEVPYMQPQGLKAKKIEQFASNLEAYISKGGQVDPYKDYGPIYTILVSVMEDSNILLYQEGMRCVRNIVKLLRSRLPLTISKHFFSLILHKLKGSLSKQHQSNVFSVLEDMLLWESISCDQFLELILQEIENGRNMGIRIGCLRWIKDGWLALGLAVQQAMFNQTPNQDQQLKFFINQNSVKIEKSLFLIWKRVKQFQKQEINLNFKRACTDVLEQLTVVDEQNCKVEVVIEDLPVLSNSSRVTQLDMMQTQQNIQEQLKSLKEKNKVNRPQTAQNDDEYRKRHQTDEEFEQRGGSVDMSQRGSTSNLHMKIMGELPREQIDLLHAFNREFIMLKKLIITGQEQQIQQKVEEIFKIIQKENENIPLLCSQVLSLLDKILIDKTRAGTNQVLKIIILQILIKINKVHVTLDERVLFKEVKLVFLKMGMSNDSQNKLVQFFESIYICCSIDLLIQVSLKLLQKAVASELQGRNIQYYFTWLTSKLNSHTIIETNILSIQQILQQIIQIQQIAPQVDLKQYIFTLQQIISQPPLNFQNEFMKSHSAKKNTKSSQFETPTVKRLQFSGSAEKSPVELTREVLQQRVEELYQNNNFDHIIQFLKSMKTVCSFSSPSSNSPGKPWRRGIGRDSTSMPRGSWRNQIDLKLEDFKKFLDYCSYIFLQQQENVIYCFDLLNSLYPQNTAVFLYYVFKEFSTVEMNNDQKYKYSIQLTNLIVDKPPQIFLQVFKQVFMLHLQENFFSQAILQVQNALPIILQEGLKGQLTLESISFIGPALVFSLTQNKLQFMAEELLHKIFTLYSRSKISQIFENDLVNSRKLYDIYISWMDNNYPQISTNRILKTQEECDIIEQSLPQTSPIIPQCNFGSKEPSMKLQFTQEDFDLLELTTGTSHMKEKNQFPQSNSRTLQFQDTIFNEIAKQLPSDQKQQKIIKNDQQVIDEINCISKINQELQFNQTQQLTQIQQNVQQLQQVTIQRPKNSLTAEDIQKIYREIKIQQIQTIENNSALNGIIPEETSRSQTVLPLKRNDCIQRLREVLLTSTSLYFDIASPLLQHYEQLETAEDKFTFIQDLKLSIVNETLLENLSETNYTVVLSIVLKLCTAPATQIEIYSVGNEESDLSQSLQLILDVLLTARSINQSIIYLLRVFNDHLPLDFHAEINRNDKMMLRLTLKCLDRLSAIVLGDDVNVFSLLLEIYKFFKFHPPEQLDEGLPSIKELEFYFRQMKTLTDKMVKWSPARSIEFVDFIETKSKKSIFLDYLKNSVSKMMTL